MEVVFTGKTALVLQGLFAAGKKTDGLLFGRTQGDTCYITDILPTGSVLATPLEKILAVDELYGGDLKGIYVFAAKSWNQEKVLAPWAFGKIIVSIHTNKTGRAKAEASIVEFDGDFFLKEIEIQSPFKEGRSGPPS